MITYADLQIDHYYLIKQNEGDEIELVQPLMETNACLLLMQHDEYETFFWREKQEELFALVDELDEEQLATYEDLFEEDDDDFEDLE